MKNLPTPQKQKTISLMSKITLLVLVVALMVIITSDAYAATDDKPESLRNNPGMALQNTRLLFNPFTLQRESQDLLGTSVNSWKMRVHIRPRIRIPDRPEVRSVFRPGIPFCRI